MATRTVRDESLKTIANAIRAKAGTTEALQFPDGMVNAVKDIKTQPDLQDKTITPTAEDQTISADTGYDGLNAVTVAGDADLISANIKRGVEIFGVKGSYSGSGGSVSTKTTAPLEVNGTDYSVDGVPQMGYYKRDYALNSTIHFAYTGNKTFLHWLDDSGKVLSEGATEVDLPFTAESRVWPVTLDESLAAQNPPRAYIEFMSEYSQVIGAGTWGAADSPEQHVLPKTALKIGAKPLGWTLDGQTVCTVQDIINSIDGSSAYKEIRALYEDIVVPLTITVGNNLDDTTFTVAGKRAVRSILTKPATGYEDYDIYCWSWDKEGLQPIGYNSKNYGIMPTHDATVYIQYVPKGTPVERLSGLTIAGAYAAGDDDDFAMVVISIFDVMSNHTRIALGLIQAFGSAVDEDNAESALQLGTGIGKTYTSLGTSKRVNYNVNIRPNAKDEVVWARAFLVYADENGVQHTVYSPVMSWTYEELIAKDKEAGIIE
jgi:hypothetical protein